MLLQDLRYAVRMLRRSPGFAAAAILSMALGIGANTAIFSLIHTLLLRPLPVQAPQELVEPISWLPESDAPRANAFAWKHYTHFRDHARAFSSLIAVSPARLQADSGGGAIESIDGGICRRRLLPDLGLRPALGRLLEPDDDRAEAPGAAVISWAYWQRRFNGDPAALGRSTTAQRRAGNHRRRRPARVLRLAGRPQSRCLGAVGDGAAHAATEPARRRLTGGQDHGAAAAAGCRARRQKPRCACSTSSGLRILSRERRSGGRSN